MSSDELACLPAQAVKVTVVGMRSSPRAATRKYLIIQGQLIRITFVILTVVLFRLRLDELLRVQAFVARNDEFRCDGAPLSPRGNAKAQHRKSHAQAVLTFTRDNGHLVDRKSLGKMQHRMAGFVLGGRATLLGCPRWPVLQVYDTALLDQVCRASGKYSVPYCRRSESAVTARVDLRLASWLLDKRKEHRADDKIIRKWLTIEEGKKRPPAMMSTDRRFPYEVSEQARTGRRMLPAPSATSTAIFAVLPLAGSYSTSTLLIISLPANRSR